MIELMIALHEQKIPLYEQIYQAIRRDIEAGRISCGEKLPSTRLLAANLNVSRFTVNLAYEQLVSEGYLQARGGSGFFVCDLNDLFSDLAKEPVDAAPERTLPVCGSEGEEKLARSIQATQATQPVSIDFSPFAIDAEHFPYNSWRKCAKASMDDPAKLLVAREAAGDERLRESIATYLYRARGVHCSTDQILVGAGHEYLLLLCTQLLGRGISVVMENPTYMQAYQVFTHAGWQVYAGETDAEGLVCMSAQAADIAYVMPSHQFPMGTVMPLGRRQELLDWAGAGRGRCRYIIEDDHDSEFRYVGKPIPSLQSRDRGDCVIYFGTFSKSISPALRMSYMVLPKHLSQRFHGQFGFYSSTVPTQQQLTVARFMESGDFERHLNRMRRIYKGKHDFLLRELKHRPWVQEIHGENAGLHLVVTVKTDETEESLIEKALARGVRLYGMDSYRIGGADRTAPVTLLLGFGGLSEGQLSEGLRVLDFIFDSSLAGEEKETDGS